MWPTLNGDAQATIGQAHRAYGDALFDYCHTTLSTVDAESAACGALISAHVHATRLAQPQHQRAWLYALTRAHRTALATANPASIGSWTRPGNPDEPILAEALAALPMPYREVLDLSVRHGLTDPEIALIFDAGAVEIEYLVTDAADRLETWIAAVNAAHAGDGCPSLTDRATEPTTTPARLRRTLISQHVAACPRCQTAPRPTTTATLLDRLPIADAPATMAARLATAEPLPADMRWRSDGFPEQPHTLTDTLATLPRPIPTLFNPSGAHASARGKEFRAWERPGHDSEEFWARRDDESDPEARLSLRPLVPVIRVGAIIAAAVASVLTAGAFWSSLQPEHRSTTVAPAAASATITLPSDPLAELVLEEPPTEQPATQRPSPASSSRTTPPARKPDKAVPRTPSATSSGPPAHSNSGPQSPPTRPSRSAGPVNAVRKLPKPAPPTANLSPAFLALGSGRTGTFALVCTGTCRIVSGTGSAGITISGTRVSVTAPASRPGCSTTTENGTATITWRGTTTGDGRTTQGTTTAGGALRLTISWTVEADHGTWIPTGSVGHVGDGQGYWTNCPNG